MIAQGLLDKYGRPNEKTPQEWKDYIEGKSTLTGLSSGFSFGVWRFT